MWGAQDTCSQFCPQEPTQKGVYVYFMSGVEHHGCVLGAKVVVSQKGWLKLM